MKGCLTYLYIFLALSSITILITGCATTSKSEFLEIHDTITANRVDTVQLYVYRTVHDTIHHLTEHFVTVNQEGDTLKVVNNNYIRERIVERDSSAYYKHQLDSMKHALNQNHDSEKTVLKKPPWWQKLTWKIIISASIALIVTLIFRKIKKRITLMR